MSFYKLAKARTAELERPEKKLRTDYGESKRVDVAKYHDELTKGKVKQNYDSLKSQHHDKINHSDYLISQTNLGKTDLLKNKLLSERMAQLNATKFQPVQEVDVNLGIGSDNAVVQEVNQVIGDFIQKISSGVFDLTMTNDLYKLYKLIQTQTYKFGSDLLERYKSYFEDVKETLDLDETANVVRSYSRKDSSVLDLMTKIVENSIKIIDKMLDAIVKGKSSDERKQILEQDVKNITFKKIDRTYLKELSDEIKNLEKSKKSEKDARKNAKNQALLEQLKNIEKVARMPEMQKQSLLYEEEQEMERQREQREREADENQGMMEQEQETREFNEEQSRVDEEQRQLEEARREEEERQARLIRTQKEAEEREQIARIREDRLQREQERREAEEAVLIRRFDDLAGRLDVLNEELDFLRKSKSEIYRDGIPRIKNSIRVLFPDEKRSDIVDKVDEYIVSYLEGTDDKNTFIDVLFDKSAEEGQRLIDTAEFINSIEEKELSNFREVQEIEEEITRIPASIDDRKEEILRDLEEEFKLKPATESVPVPAPKPAPKPKKEETAKETPLFKSTEYTSTATKITLLNGTDYYRNREQFIDKQSKIELENLLKRLNINYSKWSSTTKGDNEVNVKAFRTKAWDVLKDNPRLKLKGGSHWFKK
jgi:hypothetical protein